MEKGGQIESYTIGGKTYKIDSDEDISGLLKGSFTPDEYNILKLNGCKGSAEFIRNGKKHGVTFTIDSNYEIKEPK